MSTTVSPWKLRTGAHFSAGGRGFQVDELLRDRMGASSFWASVLNNFSSSAVNSCQLMYYALVAIKWSILNTEPSGFAFAMGIWAHESSCGMGALTHGPFGALRRRPAASSR